MRTIRYAVPCSDQLDEVTLHVKSLSNTANFYIRNTMTGIKKPVSSHTKNEKEVLDVVFRYTDEANVKKDQKFLRAIKAASTMSGLSAHAKIRKNLPSYFMYPTAESWFLQYGQLEAILRLSKNECYLNLPSHVAQNTLRKVCKSWKGYFKSLSAYKKDPSSFTGKPKIPGYNKTTHATAWYSNQVSKISSKDGKAYLKLNEIDKELCLGSENLFSDMKYVKTEIVYRHGEYLILVTFDDGIKMPKEPFDPKRILGIDVGVKNLMACVGNYPMKPFIVSGMPLKAANQWFNKRKAVLLSNLTKGKDSSHSTKNSRALDTLSRYREDFMRDYLYKACHAVCRRIKDDEVDVIVIGYNKGQKQEINTGHVNNQSFVSIPFEQLRLCMTVVAAKYGIPVVAQEESYTSQASLITKDFIGYRDLAVVFTTYANVLGF